MSTTQIYQHVINRPGLGVRSPLDGGGGHSVNEVTGMESAGAGNGTRAARGPRSIESLARMDWLARVRLVLQPFSMQA